MDHDTGHDRVLFRPLGAVGFGLMPDQRGPTGAEIRRARKALHLLQADVAEHMGVDLKTVGRWERDVNPVPDHRLGDLMDYLQIPSVTDKPVKDGDLDDDTIAAALRQASHLQILAELARRIQSAHEPDRDLPPVPQIHLQWPMQVQTDQASHESVIGPPEQSSPGEHPG